MIKFECTKRLLLSFESDPTVMSTVDAAATSSVDLTDTSTVKATDTSTVALCRASSSFQEEAAVISTSVLSGILFPTVIG